MDLVILNEENQLRSSRIEKKRLNDEDQKDFVHSSEEKKNLIVKSVQG